MIQVIAVYNKDQTGYMLEDGQVIMGSSIYLDINEYDALNPDNPLIVAPKDVQEIVNTDARLQRRDNSAKSTI